MSFVAELEVYLTTFRKAMSGVLVKLFDKPTSSASNIANLASSLQTRESLVHHQTYLLVCLLARFAVVNIMR